MLTTESTITLTPDNVTTLGEGLDHPECVCVNESGTVFAGGEAGQIYRITPDGSQSVIASTGGFILGIALDGQGNIHACDLGNKAIVKISPGGEVTERSRGTNARKLEVPNYPVFDGEGNLYVSESGEYFDDMGTGCVFIIRPTGQTEIFHHGPFRFTNGMAIDPSGEFLYIVQSTASNVVRVPLNEPDGAIEVTHELPAGTVPDGLCFASDGRLVIACYKPDGLYLGQPDGTVELFITDPTGELISRPTNAALHETAGRGHLLIANLGGWHITKVDVDMKPAPLFRPILK